MIVGEWTRGKEENRGRGVNEVSGSEEKEMADGRPWWVRTYVQGKETSTRIGGREKESGSLGKPGCWCWCCECTQVPARWCVDRCKVQGGKIEKRVRNNSSDLIFETRPRVRGHLAILQVEEDAHVAIVGVDTLHPAVECLVEIIKVVLSEAAALAACAGSVFVSHAFFPAVVSAKGLG